ncbi:putative DNA binding domain-containing protein [Burkholderia multivorans]|uniref:ATP-binding protein n=1 Tax=Burkholderia multivorans TaxID=87883 RepID=UPI001C239DEF|nr:ATP-binding protein [Burkholderia multivorans]MBU9403885.1 putative DNA binding domain-containing protein [Burkholderia multivorans]MDN8046169.1 ATP-binding protein [Burkholderia multivorans]
MKTTQEQFDQWISARAETEHLEFKEAKAQYDTTKLKKYCIALANEGGGNLILGVTDKPPRQVVGSDAFRDLADIAGKLFVALRIRVDVEEFFHDGKRVVIFHIPSRPRGTAYQLEGAYWMRSGEELVPMSEDRLRDIFDEGRPDWLAQMAKEGCTPDEVIALLDTSAYFDLLKIPYPSNRDEVLARFEGEQLIARTGSTWSISNLGAILLAKHLDSFPLSVSRKGLRLVAYDGTNKLKTKVDQVGKKGYALGFEGVLSMLHSLSPMNHVIEQAIRKEVRMFPEQAVRELVANALVHQDYNRDGMSVMIEMYSDRVEISNPGIPPIPLERFIDEYRSRNERLADLMRRMGICEERGSGIDKVVAASEIYQLPAPDFRVGDVRTTAIMFAHQDFKDMSKADRIRACYQHCVLQYVSNRRMSNQSLRERFHLPSTKVEVVSAIINQTIEAGQIKLDDSESTSRRYARYVPFWA